MTSRTPFDVLPQAWPTSTSSGVVGHRRPEGACSTTEPGTSCRTLAGPKGSHFPFGKQPGSFSIGSSQHKPFRGLLTQINVSCYRDAARAGFHPRRIVSRMVS